LVRERAQHDGELASKLKFTIRIKQASPAKPSRDKKQQVNNSNSDTHDADTHDADTHDTDAHDTDALDADALDADAHNADALNADANNDANDTDELVSQGPQTGEEGEKDPAYEDQDLYSDLKIRKWRFPQPVFDTLKAHHLEWRNNASLFWEDVALNSSFSQPLTTVFFALKRLSDQDIINNIKWILLSILLYRLRKECPQIDSEIVHEIQNAGQDTKATSEQLQKDFNTFYNTGRRHDRFSSSLGGLGAVVLVYEDNVPMST
jgi:hypothetical protein